MRMNRNSLAVSAVLALTLTATVAHAADDTLAGAFKSICLDTGGDGAKVAAVAASSGWRAVDLSPNQTAPGVRAFDKQAGPAHWQLVVQDAAYPADDALPFPSHRNLCALRLTPTAEDPHPALRAMMGVDPSEAQGAIWAWTYIERGERRDYIKPAGKAGTLAALQSGPLVTIFSGPDSAGAMIAFTRMAKVAP